MSEATMQESWAWENITSKFAVNVDIACQDIVHAWTRPSVVYRPELVQEGNQFCFTFGEWPNACCVGFGDTVEEAAVDFDNQWVSNKLSHNQAHPVKVFEGGGPPG